MHRPSLRALVLTAIIACAFGILYAPFHAAAYLATESGGTPLVPWAAPFRTLAGPAFDFGTPDEVYVAYGKVAGIGVAGLLLGVIALHARQAQVGGKAERIGFRLLVVGLGLLLLGVIVEYHTPYLEEAFMFLAGPGLLLTLAGYVTFGIGTLKARVAPRAVAWTFLLAPLVVVAMVALFGHIPLALAPLELATIAALIRTRDAGSAPAGAA